MKLLGKLPLIGFILIVALQSCKKDNPIETEKPKPSITDVEIGSGNNKRGVIGRDFHFNAQVLASEKIDVVKLKILQRPNETYSKVWSHEITWTQFKGAKNTEVHEHFNIPAEAAEGLYDFIISVSDQNGTLMEQKHTIQLILPVNLPLDPKLSIVVGRMKKGTSKLDLLYSAGKYLLPGEKFAMGDELIVGGSAGSVKGDGKMEVLLIKKSLNHRPETIQQIDHSKAIVVQNLEHKGWTALKTFSLGSYNYVSIGSEPTDFVGTPINGAKAWQSGDYHIGVLYHNATYNLHLFEYIDISAVL